MGLYKCPKCGSHNTHFEWGDDNHGNCGNVYTCESCWYVWEDGYDEATEGTEQLLQPDNGYICNRPGPCAKGQGGKCYSGFDCHDKAIAG